MLSSPKACALVLLCCALPAARGDVAAEKAMLRGRLVELEQEIQELRGLKDVIAELQAKERRLLGDGGHLKGEHDGSETDDVVPRSLTDPATKIAEFSAMLGEGGDIPEALNHIWLLLCGSLVMLMQAGFAVLETGAVRAKNAQHVLMKNLSDVCMGTLCWWSFGWMMAYGADAPKASNNFAGNKQYFTHDFYHITDEGAHTPKGSALSWFFQWAFCGAAATIVSGGVAERIRFPGYVIYTCCMTTFIYPIVVYWTWSGAGWLYGGEDAVTDVGYYDFAGSGIVHMTGGIGALVGAAVLGPRKDRWSTADPEEFAPHNVPMCVLGTFLLWFGWYGFNCGSTLGLADKATGQLAAHVAMNTTIAAATGGVTVLILRFILLRKYDVGGMCNGILAGLVSITAGCGNVETYSAFVIAILGGILYQGASSLMQLVKIDDPLDAFAVHGACGAWGALAAALFDWGKGFDIFNGWGGFSCTEAIAPETGCYKDGWVSAFGATVVGILCIMLWVAGWSILLFVPMRLLGILRVPDDIQDEGTDTREHSPSRAYTHGSDTPSSSPTKQAA